MFDLGTAIKVQRTRVHKKQSEVAKSVGCTPNYISLIENNEREPSLTMLIKLAATLNTTPATLLEEADRL